jgi:ELWxxDGT repeat protein
VGYKRFCLNKNNKLNMMISKIKKPVSSLLYVALLSLLTYKSHAQYQVAVMVKNINPGIASSNPQYLTLCRNVAGNLLYFSADNGVNGTELWKTDGTGKGTLMVKDINNVSNLSSSPRWLIKWGNAIVGRTPGLPYLNDSTIYFAASDGTNGVELWKSNGTASGTKMVKNIAAGDLNSSPAGLTYWNGKIFFSANDNITGREIWVSDGTAAGTLLLKDIITLTNYSSDPSGFFEIDNKLYFRARSSVMNSAPSLGCINGTDNVISFIGAGGGCGDSDVAPGSLTSFSGNIVFTNFATNQCGNIGNTGRELLIKRSNESFFTLLKDISPGISSSSPANLTSIGNNCFFAAETTTAGRELWKTNGTEAGTILLKNIEPGSASSAPLELTNVNGTLFFTAQSATSGRELWKSNGTVDGTVLVKDIYPGTVSSNPENLQAANGFVYFTAFDAANGRAIWKSDGTSAGTVLVYDIRTDTSTAEVNEWVNFDSTLCFAANDAINGRELWIIKTCGAFTSLARSGFKKNTSVANQYLFDEASCGNLICRVQAQGAMPLAGEVAAAAVVDAVQAAGYVKRRYDIKPVKTTGNTTVRVTLYFLQKEFDDFNAVNNLKLPLNPADGTGKANLRVAQYNSAGRTPGLFTTGTAVLINPADADIKWNGNWWEVSFMSTGLGEFIVQTATTSL